MARGRNVINQSIALEGGDEIVAMLRKMGEEGETAARKLEAAFRNVSVGKSFGSAFANLKSQFAGLQAAGSKVDDDDLALAILAGLPDEYDMIKTVIEGAEELPTIENMMAKLLLVEKRTPSREGKEEEKAYIGFNKTTRPRYGNLDRPANKRHGGSDSKSSFGKMRENRTCYACGRKGHLQKDCWQRKAEAPGNKTFNRQEVALMADEPAMEFKDYDEQDWVIDPGATMHIAAYPNLLINATPVENGPTVTFGNGKIGRGVERGTVILMDTDSSIRKIVLQDVYYVPEAEYNLLSTYQATSRGASFTFTKDRLDIDMQGERLLSMQPRGKTLCPAQPCGQGQKHCSGGQRHNCTGAAAAPGHAG